MNSHKPNPGLNKAAQMPALRHWSPNGGFDIMQSEVVDWLVAQKEIRQWLFNIVKNAGAITFDIETRTWRGVAWQDVTAPR